jgi:LmbE family N-acetylglucosaminyl deacetylase
MATLVAFHAHADDPVLHSGGTLAQAAEQGHRVVIVVATDTMNNDDPPTRMNELREAARILGAQRVEHLGYADSGHGARLYPDPPGRQRFVRADTDEAARKLAAILREENADLLLSYDPNGGYGHRDHVKVHHVGTRAGELTGVRVLQATLPRDIPERVQRVVRALRTSPSERTHGGYYSPASAITHRIDVRAQAARKQAALAAHRSDVNGTGRMAHVLRLLVRLPVPVFALIAGREWYVEEGHTAEDHANVGTTASANRP